MKTIISGMIKAKSYEMYLTINRDIGPRFKTLLIKGIFTATLDKRIIKDRPKIA